MPLEIVSRVDRGATVLEVSGDLDLQTLAPLRDALTAAASTDDRVVLDLGGTDFLDSSALGVLVGVNKQFDETPGRFAIVCAKPHLLRVFVITRLDEVLHVVPTLDAALG